MSKLPNPGRRGRKLIQLRNRKIAKSVHAFVRGSTTQFYEWLEDSDRVLPHGPSIWICGDAWLATKVRPLGEDLHHSQHRACTLAELLDHKRTESRYGQ